VIKPKSGSDPVVRNSRPADDRLAMIVNAPRSVVFQLFIGLFGSFCGLAKRFGSRRSRSTGFSHLFTATGGDAFTFRVNA